MKHWWKIALSYVGCIIIAAGAYFLVTGMMDSIFNFRSPLHAAPPQAGPAVSQPVSRQVVVVLIDGLRLDTSLDESVMPTLASLRKVGASAVMHSRAPSYSAPSYSVIFTGAWQDLSDGPAFNLEYADIPVWTQDNLFSAVSRAGGTSAISAYNWFEKLVPQDTLSASYYTPGEDNAADRAVVDAALPWIAAGNTQFILVHIDQVDYAGHHEGGARSENWQASAKRSDDLLAEIVEKMDLSQDTLLVISDHGHILMGGHGGGDPDVLLQPFVLAGKGVMPGEYADLQMVDIAPTLSLLLGTNIPASSQGQPRIDLLELPDEVKTQLDSQVVSQQTQLVKAYAAAIQAPVPTLPDQGDVSDFQAILTNLQSQRLLVERLPRIGIALLLSIAGLWLLIRFQKREIWWLMLGAGITAISFLVKYTLIDGYPFSFSAIPGVTEFVVYIGKATLLGIVLAWAGLALLRGWFRKPPKEAAARSLWLTFASLWLISLPVLVGFGWNGLIATWILPEMTLALLSLLYLVQALFIAGSGVIFSLLAAGISALRKR